MKGKKHSQGIYLIAFIFTNAQTNHFTGTCYDRCGSRQRCSTDADHGSCSIHVRNSLCLHIRPDLQER